MEAIKNNAYPAIIYISLRFCFLFLLFFLAFFSFGGFSDGCEGGEEEEGARHGKTLLHISSPRYVEFDTTLQLGSKSVEKATCLYDFVQEYHHFSDVSWSEVTSAGSSYVSHDELHIKMTFEKIETEG